MVTNAIKKWPPWCDQFSISLSPGGGGGGYFYILCLSALKFAQFSPHSRSPWAIRRPWQSFLGVCFGEIPLYLGTLNIHCRSWKYCGRAWNLITYNTESYIEWGHYKFTTNFKWKLTTHAYVVRCLEKNICIIKHRRHSILLQFVAIHLHLTENCIVPMVTVQLKISSNL